VSVEQKLDRAEPWRGQRVFSRSQLLLVIGAFEFASTVRSVGRSAGRELRPGEE
jgi:hypothetical protein